MFIQLYTYNLIQITRSYQSQIQWRFVGIIKQTNLNIQNFIIERITYSFVYFSHHKLIVIHKPIYLQKNRQAFQTKQQQYMQVRFISKKQRQNLKEQKNKQTQKQQKQALQSNQSSKTRTLNDQRMSSKNSNNKTNINNSTNINNDNNSNSETNNNNSRNMMGTDMGQFGGDAPIQQQHSDNDGQNNRQRSRNKNRDKVMHTQELDASQKKYVQQMKNKYMGTLKPQKSGRYQQNYKSKLIFEWDKKEDTVNGIISESALESLRKIEERGNRKDNQIIGKTWKQKKSGQMNDRDWRIFREDNQIFIKGGRVANPFRQWAEYSQLNPLLLNRLRQLKFVKPEPIQMQAIPIGISQKDMVALAPTGSGKTLAFLIPLLCQIQPLQRVTGANSDLGPYSIILVPSRELAEQIQQEFCKIKYGNVTAITVIGGVQLDLQILEIQKGCDILVGTPGRIKQLLDKHCLVLTRCFWAVIDQADKMISQNLVEDVQYILQSIGSNQRSEYITNNENKQKIISMFSATMLPEIQKLTKQYLLAPVFVTIGDAGAGKKTIEQHVQIIHESQKNDAIGRIIRDLPAPIIIFVNERSRCQKIANLIELRFKRSCAEYHGGKNQQSRQNIIQCFRQGKFQILVATDLGGRGLDIKGVSAAISYDAPKNISEFIHRAGRSGRAGVKGKAYTLLTKDDQAIFYDIRVFLQRNDFKVPQQLRQHPAAQVRPGAINHVSRRKQIVYTN